MRRKDRRAVAVIDIPETGRARVTFAPKDVEPEELVRLALTYGSKLRWALFGEFAGLQECFRDAVAEIVDVLPTAGQSLLGSMPSGQILLRESNRPKAAPGGERYIIRYYRTRWRTMRNRSSVWNTLPRPGLAANLVWNYCLLWDAINNRLSEETRGYACRALEHWWNAVFVVLDDDHSVRGLHRAITETDVACEIAASESAESARGRRY